MRLIIYSNSLSLSLSFIASYFVLLTFLLESLQLSFEGLLIKEAPREIWDPNILRRARLRYPWIVTLAILEQNSASALDAYDKTRELPETTTVASLLLDGYVMNGALFPGSELIICYNGLKSNLLKGLNTAEFNNACAFQEAISGRDVCPNIVDFRLYTRYKKHYMIMPKFETTLEPFAYLKIVDVRRLWVDISVALEFIHSLGFAYMDVKPANICVKSAESFVLIDLGSIVKFGKESSSTPAYVPCDFGNKKASASFDWWMLAMTLAEKVDKNRDLVGREPRSMAELMDFLQNNVEEEIYDGLVVKLAYSNVEGGL